MSEEKLAVKVDWFISSVFTGQAELNDEALAILADHAESYLRACGAISWSEWQLLTVQSRKAFDIAGDRIDEIRIEKIVSKVVERMSARVLDDLLGRYAEQAGLK